MAPEGAEPGLDTRRERPLAERSQSKVWNKKTGWHGARGGNVGCRCGSGALTNEHSNPTNKPNTHIQNMSERTWVPPTMPSSG
eukprot:12700531-Ditylum_brightwellii.AAC.1